MSLCFCVDYCLHSASYQKDQPHCCNFRVHLCKGRRGREGVFMFIILFGSICFAFHIAFAYV